MLWLVTERWMWLLVSLCVSEFMNTFRKDRALAKFSGNLTSEHRPVKVGVRTRSKKYVNRTLLSLGIFKQQLLTLLPKKVRTAVYTGRTMQLWENKRDFLFLYILLENYYLASGFRMPFYQVMMHSRTTKSSEKKGVPNFRMSLWDWQLEKILFIWK